MSIDRRSSTSLRVPRLGVVPPSINPAQNSMRCPPTHTYLSPSLVVTVFTYPCPDNLTTQIRHHGTTNTPGTDPIFCPAPRAAGSR